MDRSGSKASDDPQTCISVLPEARKLGRTQRGVCLLLGVLGLGAGCTKTHSAEGLSYFLAVKTENIYAEPIPTGGVPSGPEWVADMHVTAWGDEVPILRKRVPEVSLAWDAILEAVIYQVPESVALSPSIVATYLVVDERSRAAFEAIVRRHMTYQLLVVCDGRSIQLTPITLNLAESVPGGAFPSEELAQGFYASLGNRLRVQPVSLEKAQAWREYNAAAEVPVLWRLKCDGHFRNSMQELGWNVSELLELAEDRVKDLDCSADPPEMPKEPDVQ